MKLVIAFVVALLLVSCRKEEQRSDLVLVATCVGCDVELTTPEKTVHEVIVGTIRYENDPVDTVPASATFNFNATLGSTYRMRISGGRSAAIEARENGAIVRFDYGAAPSIEYVVGSGHQ